MVMLKLVVLLWFIGITSTGSNINLTYTPIKSERYRTFGIDLKIFDNTDNAEIDHNNVVICPRVVVIREQNNLLTQFGLSLMESIFSREILMEVILT